MDNGTFTNISSDRRTFNADQVPVSTLVRTVVNMGQMPVSGIGKMYECLHIRTDSAIGVLCGEASELGFSQDFKV